MFSSPMEGAVLAVGDEGAMEAKTFAGAPPGIEELVLEPPSMAFEPGQPVFLAVIGAVAKAALRFVHAGFDGLLGYGPEVMQEGAAGCGQAEAGLARAPEELIIFVAAETRVIIEEAGRIKNQVVDHEADAAGGSEAFDAS